MKRGVAGFRFGGATAGCKPSGRPDLGLLLADEDVPVAAVFTRNRVKGAPVTVSQERVKAGVARGVIVNAGNANACTGKQGIEDALKVTRSLARVLDVDERRVLAASTGVVGVRLPVEKILGQLSELAEGAHEEGLDEFESAILTTDRGPKTAYAEVGLGRQKVRLLGCAKGAGTVAPNMATTLAFVVTDAAVEGRWLRSALREEVDATFNDVSVDGDSSTNDSLFLFASGRAGNRPLDGGAHGRAFRAALRDVLDDLATQVVRDGLGATRVVTIEVAGAPDVKAARSLARRVGASPLVKTAMFGADPNWGRIMCALGNSTVDLDPERVDLHVGNVHLVKGGGAVGGDSEARAAAVMRKDAYTIRIHLHGGSAEGRHVTCDLTHDYVKINADYRS
jgi:glutamate N-acetyltransferase/amino-acid N-acetyltransferase